MKRVVECVLAGALAFAVPVSVALAQDEAPAAEAEALPIGEVDPAEYIDLLAEDGSGAVMGIVYDVVLDDGGKATTIVVEMFDEEGPPVGAEDAALDEELPADGEDLAAEDAVEAEPEPLPAEDLAPEDAEGTEEPLIIGALVGVSPEGATVEFGRDAVVLPAVTADEARQMPEFTYETGMKTVAFPDGYTPEAEAPEETEEE